MTLEEFKALNLPVEDSDRLYVESGLEWLRDNTTLEIGLTEPETIKSLPASARLFLVKYCEVLNREAWITSETVGPMSQSFSSDSVAKQTANLAKQFLKSWLKPEVTFIPCRRRWR